MVSFDHTDSLRIFECSVIDLYTRFFHDFFPYFSSKCRAFVSQYKIRDISVLSKKSVKVHK